MKKLGITLIIGLAFCAHTVAQDFRFGLKVAPALAWLKPDTKGIEGNGSKLGFSYGIMTDFNFTDNYAFATGLDITYRGGSLKFVTNDTTSSISDLTLQYVEIPLTMKMKTNEIGYMTYFAQFGFAPGVLIKARSDNETKIGNTTTVAKDNDIIKDISPVNISLLISVGTEYSLGGSTSILAGVTFNNGFIDVLKDKDGFQGKAIANYIALNVGVLF